MLFTDIHKRSHRGGGRKLEKSVWRTPALLSKLQQISTLDEHRGCVNTLHWSADGRLLLSGSDDCRVCIWSCNGLDKTKLAAAIITGHRRNIFSACFVPETRDREIVTCALDRQVRWVDLETEKSKHLVTCRQFCSKLAFLPGSPHAFLSAGQDGRVTLFDLREPQREEESGHSIVINLGHIGGCTALAFDPTSGGHHFSVGCDDPIVRTFDARNLSSASVNSVEPIFQYAPRDLLPSRSGQHVYERMASGPSGLAYSAVGELAVNMRGNDVYRFAAMQDVLTASPSSGGGRAGANEELDVSDTAAGTPSQEAMHCSRIGDAWTAVHFSSPATSAATRTLRRVAGEEAANEDDATAGSDPVRVDPEAEAEAGETAVEEAADAASRAVASSSSGDAGPSTEAAPMDDAVRSFERSRGRPSASAYERDDLLMVDGVPTLTRVLNTYTGRQNEETFAKEVSFTHDDAYVATGGDCGRMYLWGATSGRLVYRRRGDASIVNCVAPHPSLPLIAVSGIDSDIKLFGLGEGRPAELRSAGPSKAGRPPSKLRITTRLFEDHDDSEGWAMDMEGPPPPAVSADAASEALEAASLRREAGNVHFRSNKRGDAEEDYEISLNLLHVHAPTAELREAIEAERTRLWLNLAAVSLQMRKPSAAATWCDFVLEVDSKHVKALYRRAQAHLDLGLLVQAEEGLEKALEIEPEEPALKSLMERVRKTRARAMRMGLEMWDGAEWQAEDDDDDSGEEEEGDEEVDEEEDGDDDEADVDGEEEESDDDENDDEEPMDGAEDGGEDDSDDEENGRFFEIDESDDEDDAIGEEDNEAEEAMATSVD